MFGTKLTAIIDFVNQYNQVINDYSNNIKNSDEIQIYHSIECGLLDIQTNKLIQDYIMLDYIHASQTKEFVYYDQEYKIKIPISKVFSYMLYNIKTNKLDLKKGIEIKKQFVLAENGNHLFNLLADDDTENIIIGKTVLTSLFMKSLVYEIQDSFNEYYDTNLHDIFNQLISKKNIYLPIIAQNDGINNMYSYKLVLTIDYIFTLDDQIVDVDDELSTSINKLVDDIKQFVFKYVYENNLSSLLKYFAIISTEPTFISIKSSKTVTSLTLLFNFEYIKELLYMYFLENTLEKV